MSVSKIELKDEVQTQNGFLKEFKKEYMPSSSEMSDKAIQRYEKENQELEPEFVRENFNDILQELISLETEIYREYEQKVIRDAPEKFLDKHYNEDDQYPNTQELIDDLKQIYENDEDFEESFKEIFSTAFPLMDLISFSAYQARKTRVGHSLENHLENLLEKMGYNFDRQVMAGGAKIDLVVPSLEAFENNPDYSAFIACQTTLKDRFRLSLSKLPAGANRARRFIATATGIGLITNNDQDDITESKLKEAGNKGFRIITFDEVKDEYPNNNNIISYSTFAQEELDNLSKSWQD